MLCKSDKSQGLQNKLQLWADAGWLFQVRQDGSAGADPLERSERLHSHPEVVATRAHRAERRRFLLETRAARHGDSGESASTYLDDKSHPLAVTSPRLW